MLSDLTKYHGQGDTPRSNVLRASDPVSLKSIVRELKDGLGRKIGDFTLPGVGNGHIIATIWDLVDPDSNPGFDQAMDEQLRQIRELYKTVLPYKQPEFNAYVKASIYIYCAMLMVRLPLSTYNMVKDTVPYMHDALTSVPSNPDEVGVVAPAKIAFLEEDDIAVTLANYSFMVNRIKQLVIPTNVKRYLDWLFANLFVDSNLQAPQYYYNILSAIPLYGNVNGVLEVVQTWDLRTGKLEDILKSIESVITIGQMINADIHRTNVMIGMDLPELDVKIIDKDFEYFNLLINAYGNYYNEVDSGQATDPFKEDYIRVDVVGSSDDSHLQAAALAAARKWGQGLLCKVRTQSIYIPSIIGGIVPYYHFDFNGVSGLSQESGWNAQDSAFYISFGGRADAGAVINRVTTSGTGSKTANANTRLQQLTGYTQVDLTSSGFDVTFALSATETKKFGLFRSSLYSVYLEFAPKGTSAKIRMHDYTLNTDVDLDTLTSSSTTCPLGYNLQVGSNGYSARVTSNTNVLVITNSAKVAGMVNLFSGAGEFFYANFQAKCYYPTTANTFNGVIFNPIITMYFLEHVDYHVPMFVGMTNWIEEGNSQVIGCLTKGSIVKECYTPHILDRAGVLAYLRIACLGLFTSGGAIKSAKNFSKPRNFKGNIKGKGKRGKGGKEEANEVDIPGDNK